jgi:hypothetical protein
VREPKILTDEEWALLRTFLHLPPDERFAAMVKRGAIDKDGNVLIRGPGDDSKPPPAEANSWR